LSNILRVIRISRIATISIRPLLRITEIRQRIFRQLFTVVDTKGKWKKFVPRRIYNYRLAEKGK